MSLRILVATPVLPRPDRNAGYQRFVALLEMFARHHQVDLWQEFNSIDLSPAEIRGYADAVEAMGIRLVGAGQDELRSVLTSNRYDIGFFEFYKSAQTSAGEFHRLQPRAKIIIDSVDVHF